MADEFETADEALKEVAKMNGKLTWVLLGPDVKKKTLVDCGTGDTKELRQAIDETSHSFGMSRMTINSGPMEEIIFVYIHFVRGKPSRNTKMEKLIDSYASIEVKLDINSSKRVTEEKVLAQLMGDDVAGTSDEEKKVKKKESFDDFAALLDQANDGDFEFQEEAPAPAPKAQAPVMEEEPEPPEEEPPEEPQPAYIEPVFKQGENVAVWSKENRNWYDDGSVIETINEASKLDGFDLGAGSMKVQYGGGKRFKWVTPALVQTYLRASTRPVPPEPIQGELFKQTHNFIREWHVRHFELKLGFLQWWRSSEDASADVKPNGTICLYGMKLSTQGTILKMSTDTTDGIVYTFDATTAPSAQQWVSYFEKHHQYCQKMREHLKSQDEFQQRLLDDGLLEDI